ncbi:MAG: hypothetical protein DWQ18_07915 [Crenarchaeota archaeon]|nr:MAG: hypothetical protein DWQ17_01870 [Thermoproteota archaeon]RDJ33088.1 MAG: hypothetical protein DWQ18_07915 [Thermoproteota archaeon]RDJ36408.1 MAG: hypothetical protein DWQ19_07405 [Thermoproteota archaeon]RDJ39037.1 MAG: hypothetical protein DWQ13_01870 [Thermoproteota archaeon]
MGIFDRFRKKQIENLGIEDQKIKFLEITWTELLTWPDEKTSQEIQRNLVPYYKKLKKMQIDELRNMKIEIVESRDKHLQIPDSISPNFPMNKLKTPKSEFTKLIQAIEEEIKNRKPE